MHWLVLTAVLMGADPVSPKGDPVVALRSELAALHSDLDAQRGAIALREPEGRARLAHLSTLETEAEERLATFVELGGQRALRRAEESIARLRSALSATR